MFHLRGELDPVAGAKLNKRLLKEAGLPTRDIGELLGVSHQRASQILSG